MESPTIVRHEPFRGWKWMTGAVLVFGIVAFMFALGGMVSPCSIALAQSGVCESADSILVAGQIATDSTTNATSTTTGSVQTDGGIGAAGDVFMGGGDLTMSGSANQTIGAVVDATNGRQLRIDVNTAGFTNYAGIALTATDTAGGSQDGTICFDTAASAVANQQRGCFEASGNLALDVSMSLDEVSAPTGVANQARLYAVDNGAGKTQLYVIFGSGAAQLLATEP